MIYPKPWNAKFSGISESQVQKIAFPDEFENEAEFIREKLGLSKVDATNNIDIAIHRLDDNEIQKMLLQVEAENLKGKEAYFIDTNKVPFVLAGNTKRAVFNAAQTMLQLKNTDGTWTKARICDSPAFPVRAMHLFVPSRENIPFFRKWMEILASLKYNTIYMEVGAGMEYKKHPEINTKWEEFTKSVREQGGEWLFKQKNLSPKNIMHTPLGGGSFLTQDELKELIAYAKGLHLEIIPEVQSLSHCYYLCLAHPEIAENQDDPFPDTYCPYHPYTYELLFNVMEEIIDVFSPRMIHIGHDEWYQIGKCPACKEKEPHQILAYDIKRIHAFLASHGIKTAMWGDKLLDIIVDGKSYGGRKIDSDNINGPVHQAIDLIPKDILILNWYWWLDYYSENYFREKGFDMIYGNFHPFQFPMSERRFHSKNVKGAEVSSWCDVSEKEYAYHGIIQNTIFASEMLWTKNYNDQDKAESFEKVKKILPEIRNMISGTQNIREEKSEIIKPENSNYNMPFSIPGIGKNAFSGKGLIKINRKISGLNFIHFTHKNFSFMPRARSRKAEGYPDEYYLGKYIIRTTKSEYEIPVTYLVNISSYKNHPLVKHTRKAVGGGYDLLYFADVYYEGKDDWNNPAIVYSLPWKNPDPDDPVVEIQISGTMILAGLEVGKGSLP